MSSTASINSTPSLLPSKARWQAIVQATVLENRWIPKHPLRPSLKQSIFLACEAEEAFYGGAAAGGKSEALLMGALQYVEVPGYAAMIFRKTYADLALPGALMDRAHEWLGGTAARWSDKEKTWHFPSGATLTFGYLDNVRDHFRYQGAQFDYCAFDELTQFPENQYRYLFSRLRRLQGSRIPSRMRAASNPGGVGHDWVKERFLTNRDPTRIFIPARMADNPAVDQAQYIRSLDKLDPITRAQLLAGDWEAYEGGRFKKEWFRRYVIGLNTYDLYRKGATGWELVQSWPKQKCWCFGTCDPAASERDRADYTAIGAWCVTPGKDLLCLEVVRKHLAVEGIVPEIRALCGRHALRFVAIEDVSFQAMIVAEARRTVGIPAVRGVAPGGKDKLVRATPAIIRAESGQFYLPERAPWLEAYLTELLQFSGDAERDAHDDQVDMTAYAALEVDRLGVEPVAEEVERRPSSLVPRHDSNQRRRGMFGVRLPMDEDRTANGTTWRPATTTAAVEV
jgi:predicted phage terminase large subunit-like protein